MRLRWCLVVLLVVGSRFVAACESSVSPAVPIAAPSAPPVGAQPHATKTLIPRPQVSARIEELLGAYQENEVAADLRFKSKWIGVSARVGEVAKGPLGDAVVYLVAKDPSAGRVAVYPREDQLSAVVALKRGAAAVIFGRGSGMVLGEPVLREAFVDPPMDDDSVFEPRR